MPATPSSICLQSPENVHALPPRAAPAEALRLGQKRSLSYLYPGGFTRYLGTAPVVWSARQQPVSSRSESESEDEWEPPCHVRPSAAPHREIGGGRPHHRRSTPGSADGKSDMLLAFIRRCSRRVCTAWVERVLGWTSSQDYHMRGKRLTWLEPACALGGLKSSHSGE